MGRTRHLCVPSAAAYVLASPYQKLQLLTPQLRSRVGAAPGGATSGYPDAIFLHYGLPDLKVAESVEALDTIVRYGRAAVSYFLPTYHR